MVVRRLHIGDDDGKMLEPQVVAATVEGIGDASLARIWPTPSAFKIDWSTAPRETGRKLSAEL